MKKLFYFLLSLLALVGCTESETDNTNNNQGGGNTEPSKTELTVNVTYLSFDAEADVKSIDISSSDAWTAEFVNDRASEWCSLSPTSGQAGNSSILVNVTDNNSGEERSASIIIKAKSLQKIVKVTQKQNDAITVTSSKFEVKAEGGEVEIEVKANVDYDYSIEESAKSWVTYKTTRAMQSSTLVFDVAENSNIEKREAKITFKSGDIKEVVTIYQEGTEYAIVISKNEYTVSDKGETIAVEVKSNVDVAVEIPSDVDWVKENSTRAMSTNTYYFEVSPNEDYNSRSTAIKFTNKENNLSETVTITQAQKDAIVIAKDSYTIDNYGGAIDIEVGHNVDFDVEISDSWITKASTRAFETETLTFNIAANNSNDGREGTIKFTSKDKAITQTVKVYQSQSNALIVSKKDIVIDEKEQSVEFEVRANVEYTVSSSSASWLHREDTRAMTSQTIRYRVDANSDYNSREAKITVQSKDGSLKETITITQAQKDAIVLAKNSYTIDNEGGEIDIEVGHNVDFDVEISHDWITKTSTRAFETETLTFNIAANNSDDSREGTIKFISKDKSITQTVKVFQSQSNALIVSKKDIVIDDKEQTVEFEVSANVEYTVSSSSASWLHREDTRAMASQTIRYRVDANSDYNSREAKITVQSKDGSLKETITITQAQKDAIVLAKNSYTIDNEGGEIDIEVGHNVDFDVEISDSWITKTSTRAFETETLTFNIAANNSNDGREGTIKFISKDKSITQTIKVSQEEYDPTKPRNNEIWYTTTDGKLLNPYRSWAFGANIVSNTYENGKGVITFDGSVTTIGNYAFYYCRSLKRITIPDSVTEIGEGAFENCSSLTTITIPNSVTQIGEKAFTYCSLVTITIPDSVTELGEGAFSSCADLTIASIGDGVTSIGADAFLGCRELKRVTIGNNVTIIGFRAFDDCSKLTSITIPDSVIEIGWGAFGGCKGLTNVTIGNSVTTIGHSAFSNCSSLTSITIPDSVTEIGYSAFPNSISAFYGKYASADNRCLIIDGVLKSFAGVHLTSYTIPDSVTAIEQWVFSYYGGLENIIIPDSVTEIGNYAFYNCRSITSITIPKSVTEIGERAFQACSRLKSIYCKPTTPPSGYHNMFNDISTSASIYVPMASVEAYTNADGWFVYADIIVGYDFNE